MTDKTRSTGCRRTGAEFAAKARGLYPNDRAAQLAALARAVAVSAPDKQNARAVCATIPWYLIHALREIIGY